MKDKVHANIQVVLDLETAFEKMENSDVEKLTFQGVH